jgi:TusA-related sulfurtransferase
MFNWLKRLFASKSETIEVSKTQSNTSQDNLLDCRNMNCPMPIIKISQKFKSMNIGDSITVIATDPAFQPDVEAWVRKTENELVSFEDKGHEKVAVIKKLK